MQDLGHAASAQHGAQLVPAAEPPRLFRAGVGSGHLIAPAHRSPPGGRRLLTSSRSKTCFRQYPPNRPRCQWRRRRRPYWPYFTPSAAFSTAVATGPAYWAPEMSLRTFGSWVEIITATATFLPFAVP